MTDAEVTQARGVFRSLRVRNYRFFASANMVSLIGTWMQRIGQDWLVLQLSGDNGIALGLVTALQFAPGLLLSMYGGVLADRYPKRRTLLITQALMGTLALTLGLLVATGAVALWHVLVLAAALGSVSAVDIPVRQTFVSEMVGPDLLTNAVGLNSTIFNGARLVGPAVAGLLIGAASGDTAPAFLINAGSFAATMVALLAMRADELLTVPPVARARGQLRAGLAYTWARADLRLALGLAFLAGTFGLSTQVTIALMARQQFGLGAEAFGLLTTAFAVGSLSGALLSARRTRRPDERFLAVAVSLFGVALVVAGLMPSYVWFAVALVPVGLSAMTFTVANNTFVQLGVEPAMRGRVMALYFMCLTGGLPLGSPAVGVIGEHLGAPWAFVLSGLLMVVSGLAAVGWLTRRRRGAGDDEAGVPGPRPEVATADRA